MFRPFYIFCPYRAATLQILQQFMWYFCRGIVGKFLNFPSEKVSASFTLHCLSFPSSIFFQLTLNIALKNEIWAGKNSASRFHEKNFRFRFWIPKRFSRNLFPSFLVLQCFSQNVNLKQFHRKTILIFMVE